MGTVWGFSVLQGKPWAPWVLGGSGDTRFCWTDGFPFQAIPEDLQRFYLTALGYHVSEFVRHLMEARSPDFWEMLLHHIIACALVYYSYMLNYVRVGSLVLLLHGVTDILIYFSKAIIDTPANRLTAISYVALVISYAWFRIYIFPVYIMQSAWIESIRVGEEIYGWGFLNFALCVLCMLHIYWFGLIVRMGVLFGKTGQTRDLQANLSSMDMLKKKT